MAIFTAIAATVSAAVGGGIFGAIAGFAARTLLTIGITKLIGNRAGTNAAGTQDTGARIQLPPASNNKVPVVYGTAYVAPIITDAKISEDQRTMWYVCTLAEVTDTGSYTFGDIYYEGKRVVFDGTDTSKVTQLVTNSDPAQVDDKISGQLYMWKFPNGSSSGISTGGANAITLLSDAGIPDDLQWDSALYTTGGQSAQMSNLAFIVVKVIYNDNAGTTSLKQMSVELTNSLDEPGSVIKDYLQNVRYGCAIPIAQIDTASLTALDVYSAEQITYYPVGYPVTPAATQDRYKINGPINTGQNCLANLQQLVDDCDSWLQYNELTGQWKVVINKEFDGAIGDLYKVTDSNLMSGINVNPIDLNSAYNILEVQYPNNVVKDQTDYATFKLVDYAPEVMSPNEPENILTVQYGQVNNYIQSVYLGQRRLLQSREDLVIDFTLDYSGIQIEAGDVITVKFEPYAWDVMNSGEGKLFRVSQVQEAKIDDGTLGVKISAFEYNATIYADNPIQDFIAADNTGLTDPNILGRPDAPIIANVVLANSGAVASFSMTSSVPSVGSITMFDFNLGNSSNVETHKLYTTLQSGAGVPFTAGETLSITVNDQKVGTYYGSVTARTTTTGVQSYSSGAFNWTAGLQANSVTGGASGANSMIQANAITNTNILAGSLLGTAFAVGTITANSLGNSGVTAGSYTSTNITVNAQGLITSAANGTGGGNTSLNLGDVTYSVAPSQVGLYTVVDLAGEAFDYNAPVYLDGTTVSSSYYYPFFSGTSSTANGYYANSSGSFNPATASYWSGNQGQYGGWYSFVAMGFPVAVPAGATLVKKLTVQLVANANTSVQINPTGFFTSYGNTMFTNDQSIATYDLIANKPMLASTLISQAGDFSDVSGSGYVIRNMVAGTRVNIVTVIATVDAVS
jgi:hypothetical protein